MSKNIEQRSPEWFAQRKGKITGSVVGAALGLNPYMTPTQLMRRLVREWHGAESEFKGSIATEYGVMHEPIAQLAYAVKTGNAVHEIGFLSHPSYDWLGASPDGIILADNPEDNAVLEIKCPFGLRNDNPPQFKKALEQPHYYAQMQIEMLCAGVNFCHFYQWSPHGDSLEIVKIDFTWLAVNLKKLFAFYKKFEKEKDNPDHLAPAIPEIESAKAANLLAEYDAVCEQSDIANARKKEIIDELVEIAKGKTTVICGRKLQLIKREGAISYQKAVKDLLPDADLSAYQGKPTTFWKLG